MNLTPLQSRSSVDLSRKIRANSVVSIDVFHFASLIHGGDWRTVRPSTISAKGGSADVAFDTHLPQKISRTGRWTDGGRIRRASGFDFGGGHRGDHGGRQLDVGSLERRHDANLDGGCFVNRTVAPCRTSFRERSRLAECPPARYAGNFTLVSVEAPTPFPSRTRRIADETQTPA